MSPLADLAQMRGHLPRQLRDLRFRDHRQRPDAFLCLLDDLIDPRKVEQKRGQGLCDPALLFQSVDIGGEYNAFGLEKALQRAAIGHCGAQGLFLSHVPVWTRWCRIQGGHHINHTVRGRYADCTFCLLRCSAAVWKANQTNRHLLWIGAIGHRGQGLHLGENDFAGCNDICQLGCAGYARALRVL